MPRQAAATGFLATAAASGNILCKHINTSESAAAAARRPTTAAGSHRNNGRCVSVSARLIARNPLEIAYQARLADDMA